MRHDKIMTFSINFLIIGTIAAAAYFVLFEIL